MQFEELDKKIKEAADNHHPAYNEGAWDKMEGLLNKHMPEKKNKRRLAFWLFLLLLTVGGGSYLLFNKPMTENAINVSAKSPEQIKKPIPPDQEAIKTTNGLSQNENNIDKKEPVIIDPLIVQTKQKDPNRRLAVIKSNAPKKRPFTTADNLDKSNATTPDQNFTINPDPSINKSNKNVSDNSPIQNGVTEMQPVEKEKNKPDVSVKTDHQISNQPLQETKTKKQKAKKGNGLFISLSAGPDIGAVGLNEIGRLRLAGGIGLGYKISNRISIQTGFYIARKIYTASPKDYNAPDWWWQYYPTLESVNADCKVYEIPLLVSYHFANNKKGGWFALAGLSSYLMKKEAYDYNYKLSTGQPATRHWEYYNTNKHYFSVITLAGGYEKKLNKNLSLSISPYLKMPWQGVGFGKVKLNSTGVLFGVNYKPFAKK